MPRDAVSRTANVERTGLHKWVNNSLVHLIGRSSSRSDNHRKRGKVLKRHKAAARPAQSRMKINMAEKFKYMSRIVCQMQN